MYFSELNQAYTHRPVILAVRGVALLAFGLSTFLYPVTAARLLVFIVAIGLLFDGLVLIIPALLGRVSSRLIKITTTKGVFEIVVGLFAISHELFTWRAFAFFFALLVIFRGVLRFITFVELDTPVRFQRFILLQSLMTILIGVLLLLFPFTGKVAFVLFVGAFSMIEGVELLQKAWRRNDEVDGQIVLPEAIEHTIIGEMS